jgi:iron complex outermembrane receptor protein
MYRDASGYRDDKDSSLAAVNPALVWRPNADTRVALNLEYVKSEFAPDTGIPPAGLETFGVPRTLSYQSPFDVSEQDIYRLRFDVEKKIGERLTLRDKVYYTDLEWVSNGTLVTGLLPNRVGTADVVRSFVLLDDRQKLLGNQAEALLSFGSGRVTHTLMVGLEVSQLTDDFVQDVAVLPNLEIAHPVETARQPLPILPGFGLRGDTRAFVVAPYVVERASFSDSFQLFAGARLDALDYEDDANGITRDDTKLSPMGGIVFSPTKELSLYASAGSAFGPPSSQVVGDRTPEESWQAEVGLKRSFLGGRGFASVALYHLDKDNIAIPDASGILRRQGDQRSRGIEVEATVEAAKNVYAAVSYAHNDAELTRFAQQVITGFDFTTFQPTYSTVDRSGNTPAFAPRHILNAWVMKQLGRVDLGIGGRFVSGQFIGEDNEQRIDDYVTLDAMASLKTGRVKWSLNLRNLTDTEYETRGFGSASVIPADPIAVYGKIEVNLGGR